MAAAAASPHRSTLNAARDGDDNPEDDDDDDWRAEPPDRPSHRIFPGKSNDDAGRGRSSRRHRESPRERGGPPKPPSRAPAPPPGGRVPGGAEDPAAASLAGGRDTRHAGGDPSALPRLARLLRARDPPLDVVEMEGDGNCLFRAISLQVYGDTSMHPEVRRRCLDFMEGEADHFRDFVADEDFGEYVARKRGWGEHGNHAEIQAASELYNRSIEVFVPAAKGRDGPAAAEPINIFHSEYKGVDEPIRLCYTDGNHYDAITDPLLPTAGLGLGLPGLQPGLADRLQLDEAKKISDESALEEKMRLALEESNRASKAREEVEMKEAMRKSSELENAGASTFPTMDSDDDVYKRKALYLSEMEAADFDLEQAVRIIPHVIYLARVGTIPAESLFVPSRASNANVSKFQYRFLQVR